MSRAGATTNHRTNQGVHISAEPRINERIRVPEVRLVGPNGEQVGIVRIEDALRLAAEADLDLVEVAPMSKPPVCKLMDYGKFKYESALKAREDRKKQVNTVIKEMKLRPKIDAHDYETKKGHVVRFLKAGDKVKITIMFRGREQSRPELGFRLLKKLADDVADIAFVEYSPKQDGRNMIMVLGPVRKKAEAMAEAQAEKDAKKGRRHDEADGELEATGGTTETTTDVTEPAPAEVETVETAETAETAETVEATEAAQADA
ncbi:translation initiation factor IF-3 [Longivirga aurantiaca]|uniref:Translation initiation factor IF-3 n=1 Tax=Longivirga aurantiaca TaxID=1837743 RepID=A0ABW1T2Y0_9ACTN